MIDKRGSGILMPVFSLPGRYGIGAFSKEARKFVDFLKESGQKYWQILPLGPTSYGDSPYQSFSTFAINPYFIDIDALIDEGLLTLEEAEAAVRPEGEKIDYLWLYETRLLLLKRAHDRFKDKDQGEYRSFTQRNAFWLEDYALFMAVKKSFGDVAFVNWPEDIRFHEKEAVYRYSQDLSDQTDFYKFIQFKAFKQWSELKNYANSKGIKIIGDIPIYVAYDSSDAWTEPLLFQMDEKRVPSAVAGCPPDGFSADGQLWGNPLYNWDYHESTGFEWWIKRVAKCRELYDVIRIDHFRGFDEYYSVPYGDTNARGGRWLKGPGIRLFDAIREKLGDIDIIAEDLGYITDTVKQLVRDTGFPNMKVLEFAFDLRDSSGPSEYLPHNYGKNCVVYTGTHDNETLLGWLSSIRPEEVQMVRDYTDRPEADDRALVRELVRQAMASTAVLCVIPLQDYLELGNEARINHPSVLGGNWQWRALDENISDALSGHIKKITQLYGR